MVHGLHRILFKLAGAAHLAVSRRFGLLHANANDLAVLAQHFDRRGIEVHIILAISRITLVIHVTVIFHVFRHLTNREQLFDHLTGQLILAGFFNRVFIQIEIVFVDDQLHSRQFLHLTQFLHGELGLRHTATDEQVQHASLVLLDALVHIVWNISAFLQIVGIAHEFARHIHGHVATADHGNFLSFKRPFASAGRITVVPFHKLGCAIHAIQVGARQSKRLVLNGTGGEQHGIVTLKQLVEGHVLAEFHVAIQVDVGVVERLFECRRDEFDGRVVGGHAITYQAERHRQLFEQVDARGRAEAKLLAELLQLAQENVGGVDACRAGADYSNTKFISFSHAL